jgi:hypothetical protein
VTPDYTAFALLDPEFHRSHHGPFRALLRLYRDMASGAERYNHHLNRILNPFSVNRPLAANLQTAGFYLREAEAYVQGLADLLPADVKDLFLTDEDVSSCSDPLILMRMAFTSASSRTAFEAQRKLYLAKLIFDIDRCRDVQDGLEHKSYLESILEGRLLSRSLSTESLEIWYSIGTDGVSMEYGMDHGRPDQERWHFDLRTILPLSGNASDPIHIYYNRTRFKKEVLPFEYSAGQEKYKVHEQRKWFQLKGRRNGGILSKMIRKRENNPRNINDILGTMFIVRDRREVTALLGLLYDILGAPFKWYDVVDTINRPEDRQLLDRHSAPGYEVYKGDVDVLYPMGWKHSLAYAFRVEIQIYTLEGFLRTVHSSHYASHQELKRRQFFDGVLPYVFPPLIYGEHNVAAREHLSYTPPDDQSPSR